jgi:hypothetical protein
MVRSSRSRPPSKGLLFEEKAEDPPMSGKFKKKNKRQRKDDPPLELVQGSLTA